MEQSDRKNVYAPPAAPVADPGPEQLIVRPRQIIVAAWLLWIAASLGAVMSFVNFFALDTPVTLQQIMSWILMWIIVLTVNGWIIYCITLGKNWARIFKLITSGFSLTGLMMIVVMKNTQLEVYSRYFQVFEKQPSISQAISWFNTILLLVIMWLLFTKPGSEWFRRKNT